MHKMCHDVLFWDAPAQRPFTDRELDLLDGVLDLDSKAFEALVVAARLLRASRR